MFSFFDKTLYLADDDPDDQDLFKMVIENIDPEIQVYVANDGTELLQLLTREDIPNPDLIFLDVNMPKMNGFDTLKWVKESLSCRKIPTVIMSTSNETAPVEKACKTKADGYIRKQESIKDLHSHLKKALTLKFESRLSC